MHRTLLCVMALAVAWGSPSTGRAQDAELSKLREEVRQLRQAYESRIQALERRLQETEAKAGKAETAAAQSASLSAPMVSGLPTGVVKGSLVRCDSL